MWLLLLFVLVRTWSQLLLNYTVDIAIISNIAAKTKDEERENKETMYDAWHGDGGCCMQRESSRYFHTQTTTTTTPIRNRNKK
jgi:hypothetical protein